MELLIIGPGAGAGVFIEKTLLNKNSNMLEIAEALEKHYFELCDKVIVVDSETLSEKAIKSLNNFDKDMDGLVKKWIKNAKFLGIEKKKSFTYKRMMIQAHKQVTGTTDEAKKEVIISRTDAKLKALNLPPYTGNPAFSEPVVQKKATADKEQMPFDKEQTTADKEQKVENGKQDGAPLGFEDFDI